MSSPVNLNHNKKRNVGVVYELLLRAVSSYIVENKKDKAQATLDIISKRFAQDTELFKEFRLFNALAKTKITDPTVAAVVLTETKAAARRLDQARLDKEKSLLIRDINHGLNDPNFYHRRLPNYRDLATIQVAINEWVLGDRSNFSQTLMVESKLLEQLKNNNAPVVAPIEEQKSDAVDNLVVKILNEKFNKKYEGKMTEDQRALIRDYVVTKSDGATSKDMIDRAKRIKQESLQCLTLIEKSESNAVIQENIKDVKRKVESLDVENLDDDSLSKLMTLSQLIKESRETK
jgi:hypothetical protein